MNTDTTNGLNEEGNPAQAGSPRVSTQERALWKRVTSKVAMAAGIGLIAVGCATSNFDFDAQSEESEVSRVVRLSKALEEKEESGEADSLHEASMAPLLHTHLKVFERSNEKGIPDGFVEAETDAYLPLFGVVDLKVDRYDNDLNKYESHRYDSYLWGLFQNHKEQIATPVGLRQKETRRFLWFISWRSSPKYVGGAS